MAENILIIEDDAFLRELLGKKLSSSGYNVSEAIDGKKGLELVDAIKPDLVLLDLLLPGVDGFEVLEKIKANPMTASIPVIILSNLGQKEDVDKGLKLGAADYMIKAQFTPEEIILKVQEILKKVN